MSVHTGIYESDKKVIHFAPPLEESSRIAELGTAAAKAAAAAAVATAQTAVATEVGGPVAGGATAAAIIGTSTLFTAAAAALADFRLTFYCTRSHNRAVNSLKRTGEAMQGYALCWKCRQDMLDGGVVSCCLDCFLEGDNLRLFAYSVPFWFYAASNVQMLANRALQTCTGADEDPPEMVLKRANDLLACNGFGGYNLVTNNCFDFAFYCKTGVQFVSPARLLGPKRDGVRDQACMIL